MLPPGIKLQFEENDTWNQALLLAYEQVRTLEEIPPDVKTPHVPSGRRPSFRRRR